MEKYLLNHIRKSRMWFNYFQIKAWISTWWGTCGGKKEDAVKLRKVREDAFAILGYIYSIFTKKFPLFIIFLWLDDIVSIFICIFAHKK